MNSQNGGKMKQISKFNRFLSGVLSMVMVMSAIPTVSVHAEEKTSVEPYPYTMFAASNEEGAITVNANNFSVNGNIATNGTIVSSGNMNVNGTRMENAEESMIFIFDKIDNQYFSATNVEEHDEDYTLDEMNISINVPTEVQGEATLTGNININNALKALEDVNLYGEVKNTNNSVIVSQFGDITIDSQNVNLNGLLYAPYGKIDISAQNLNLNNVVIIADRIKLECPNINANLSCDASRFVGTLSEDEKRIIVFKDGIKYSGNNTYVLTDTFDSLNGYLGKSEEIVSFMCTVYDKNDTSIYNKSLPIQSIWSINQIGFINGYNKIILKAIDKNGIEYVSQLSIYVNTSKYMRYMQIDSNDNDGDGLWNYFETYFGTDMDNADSDYDGLSDFLEIYTLNFNPNSPDTDENGILDGNEDCDGDGLSNSIEIELNSNPISADTDRDKLIDALEYEIGTKLDEIDTDKDGLTDYEEYINGINPLIYNNPDEIITKTYSIDTIDMPYDQTVYPSIELKADYKGISTFKMSTCEHDEYINNTIPGFIGSAYDFSTEGKVNEAILTFTIDENYYNERIEDSSPFNPTIYYLNEETGKLEEVEGQIRNKNTISVSLQHFSIYVVINKDDIEAFWSRTIQNKRDELEINRQIVFLLDTSGSMNSNDPNYIRTELVKEFASRMDENTKISIMSFDNDTQLFTNGFTNSSNEIESAVDSFIEYGNPGGTYIYKALKSARDLISGSTEDDDSNTVKTIFLLTDGVSFDDVPSSFLDDLYNNKHISVHTVGLGNVSETYLRRISDVTKGHYYYARIDTDLEQVFLDFESNLNFVDANNDGIDDYTAYLMCCGDITTHSGNKLFDGIDYNEFQNDTDGDWDNDGLKNGEEIVLYEENGIQYIKLLSDPTIYDTDFDGYSDGEEVANGSQNNTVSFVISEDDYNFLSTNGKYMSCIAAEEYVGDGDGWDIAGICIERFFDVVMCGGEISLDKRVRDILLQYMIDFSDSAREQFEASEYYDTINDSIQLIKTLSVDCGTKAADFAYGQQLRQQISDFQKDMNTFRKSADRATKEGAEHYRTMQKFLKDLKKDINNYDEKIDKLKNQGSSLAKKADTTFKVLSAVDDISSIIQYNYNLKQLDCCRFILEDLQSCGFSEIEDAASALLRDMNNSFDATAYATVDKLVDFGTDYLIDKVTDTIASWGTGGLIGTVVLAVGGIVFGESLGADLENSISSNLSKSISEAGLDILYENTKHIKSSSGVYNRVANYTWNCNPIKMYLPSIISARKYSEQKYIDIITEKNWFIDKGAFVYKTSTSESDAKNNISHLNDVLYKYCA